MFAVRPDLLRLYESTEPVASLYLRIGLDAAVEGRQLAMLRWRALRRELAAQGAPESVLRRLDGCVRSAPPGGRTLAAFATGDGVLCFEYDGDSRHYPADGLVRYGALPYGLPLLRWCQFHPPYVLALVDRTGADLIAHRGGLPDTQVREHVVGPDDEIERNKPGGWSQLRYQHRAEDSWEHNAVEVSRYLTRLADAVAAEVVLAAGDVRALQFLHEHLPQRVLRLVRPVSADGAQREFGPAGVRPETVAKAIGEAVTDEVAARLRRLAESSSGRVAWGPAEVTYEASYANVGTLFVVDDGADERVGHLGPTPVSLVLEPDDGHPYAVRLVDGLVGAAVVAGGDVVVLLPEEYHLPGGIAATLRH